MHGVIFLFGMGVNGGAGAPVASVVGPPVMPTTDKGRGPSFSTPAVGKVGPGVMRAAIEGVKVVLTFRTLIWTHDKRVQNEHQQVRLCSLEVWVLTFAIVPRGEAGRTGPP